MFTEVEDVPEAIDDVPHVLAAKIGINVFIQRLEWSEETVKAWDRILTTCEKVIINDSRDPTPLTLLYSPLASLGTITYGGCYWTGITIPNSRSQRPRAGRI